MVLGPFGGGERAPLALRRGLGWRGWLLDAVRDLHTWLIRFDPITRWACADAVAIYVKTAQPGRRCRGAIGTRSMCARDRHARGRRAAAAEHRAGEPLRLLFAGRFLYWKGMHFGMRALPAARPRHRGSVDDARRGPEEQAWRALADELELGPCG